MSWWNELVERLRGSRAARELDQEMSEEMAFHIEMGTREDVRRGYSEAEARRRAMLRFGSVERFKEEGRNEQRSRVLEDVLNDLRYAARTLLKTPGFTLVALLSLGLGIGANTAIFSVVESVLLRRLPYPEPGQVIDVGLAIKGNERPANLSVADFNGLKEATTLEAIGAYNPQPGGISYVAAGVPGSLPATLVTSGVFEALGVAPLMGRLPNAEEDVPGTPAVVLLSYAAWREHFGAAPDILGKSISLASEPFVVIAVMPPDFRIGGLPANEIWPIMQLDPPEGRAPFWLQTVARVKDGVSLSRLEAELRTIEARVREQYPRSANEWSYAPQPMKEKMIGDAGPTVLVLFGAVALVLLIAAANVANLLLARATTRVKEMAVRTALGAGRGRLARQLLTESALLACLGALVGIGLAYIIVQALPSLAPRIARLDAIQLNATVLGFTLAVALLTGLLIGLVPALRLPRAIAAQLRAGGRGGTGDASRGRFRAATVVFEFALALTVLIGAGLVVTSLLRLQSVASGVRVERILTAQISVPLIRYRDEAAILGVYDRFLTRVRELPGVETAALSMGLPPDRLVMRNPYVLDGAAPPSGEDQHLAEQLLVTPEFFSALGIRLIRGRLFTPADAPGAPNVAVVNETFARKHFDRRDPTGHYLQTGNYSPENPRVTIVGVVSDVRYQGLDSAAEPTLYVPFAQHSWWNAMSLVVRGSADPMQLVPAIRSALQSVDPELPLREVTTLERMHHASVAAPRFRGALLGSFALLALVLATAGIYGIVSYDVNQRRRETAIRMALGATASDVLRGVMRAGVRITALGVLLGVASALAATRLLQSLLFEVEPTDPLTFGSMTLLLAGIALLACVIPAYRATRVEPQGALSAE